MAQNSVSGKLKLTIIRKGLGQQFKILGAHEDTNLQVLVLFVEMGQVFENGHVLKKLGYKHPFLPTAGQPQPLDRFPLLLFQNIHFNVVLVCDLNTGFEKMHTATILNSKH